MDHERAIEESEKKMDGLARDVSTATKGQRNVALYRAAFTVGTKLPDGLVSRDGMKARLVEAALANGTEEKEARDIIERALKHAAAYQNASQK